MGRLTQRRRTTTVEPDGAVRSRIDSLVVEEPLEVRLGGAPWSLILRTPGHDIELVHGLLLSAGVIGSREDVGTARYCEGTVTSPVSGTDVNTYNVLNVSLRAGAGGVAGTLRVGLPLSDLSGPGDDLCGRAAIDTVRPQPRWTLPADRPRLSPALLRSLPDRLGQARKTSTGGGLDAAALFHPTGELLVIREDISATNAVDKVQGWALLQDRLPLRTAVLVLSGRVSVELVRRAVLAGLSTVLATRPPSALAVDLAEDTGLTLADVDGGGRLIVHTGAQHLGIAQG